jgi:hypothetical protein
MLFIFAFHTYYMQPLKIIGAESVKLIFFFADSMVSHMPLWSSSRLLRTETTMSRKTLSIKNLLEALAELSRRPKPLTSLRGCFEL